MTDKTIRTLFVVALIAAVFSAGAWYHAIIALEQLRSQLVATELQPAAMMLRENQTLIGELGAEPFIEKDSGVLESYLAKIRRDGVARHADMKQRLDQLAENNTAIVTLIKAYSPHARMPSFTAEGDR